MLYSDTGKFPSGLAVPDMRGWSVAAAFGLAVSLSGKSDEEIAGAMGWSGSVKSRAFSNKDYWPSLPTIPRFCEVVGNAVIARWIVDNTGFLAGQAAPSDGPALMRQIRGVLRATSGVMEEAEKALDDGKIVTPEARRILRELSDLFRAGGEMLAGLQAVIERERNP